MGDATGTAPDPPRQRVTGRILSLGFPLPGVRVDNYSFLSAPAFFDYDAIVVSPAALSLLIESVMSGETEARTYADAPVRIEPRDSGDVALADVLLRRRDETQRLLAHGGVIVCFAAPSRTHTIAGETVDDYYWLPDPPPLVAGDGAKAHVVDFGHPLAPFVLGQSANIAYGAYADLDRMPGGRVFARSYGGAPIGVEAPAASGRIVYVPMLKSLPAGEGRYAMAEAIQAGIRRMLGVMAEGREPFWLASCDVPGLAERESAREAARAVAEAAQGNAIEAEAASDALARYRRLLWQEGADGLEPVVVDALRIIGFGVYAQDPDAIELRVDGASILIEVDAADGAVGMAAHYRLRQRIERTIERRTTAPRGLIFVNGFRLQRPAERPPQASDGLRLSAETMRYCVATTSALFDAVVAQLNGDTEAVAAFRACLTRTDGYLGAFA